MNLTTRQAPSLPGQYNGTAQPSPRPLPTRTRRPGLIAAAVLLVVGFGLAGALLVARAGNASEVLVAARPIPAGQTVTAADLMTVQVAGPVRAIAAGETATVLGQTSAVGLVAGQVLNRDMLTAAAVPAAGQATVGLALAPGRLPADGLNVGDRVHALAVPAPTDTGDAADPATLLATGQVYGLRPDAAGAGMLVTLLVPADAAVAVAGNGAAGRVVLVEIPAGAGR